MDRDFISMFDSVIVGLASPASVAANHIYPALWVASLAYESLKLTIMTDTPEPHKLWAGLVSVAQSPGTLVKDFYARRKGFREAVQPKRLAALQGFVEALSGQEWPPVVAPALPWTEEGFLTRHIPMLPEGRSVGLRLDRGIDLPFYNPIAESVDKRIWYADSTTSNWAARITGTLAYPVEPVRANRKDTASELAGRLRGSLGLLLTTYRSNEAWWSPLVMLALSQRAPVVSDWRHTGVLGGAWSCLPVTIESMSIDEREQFAKEQMSAYLDASPGFAEEAAKLLQLIQRTSHAR